MRVVKTRLDLQESDTKSDVNLLGAWCINDNLNLFENIKSYKILPYHWEDKDKFIKD